MFVKLHKILKDIEGGYYLSEVVVNPVHIVYMAEDDNMNRLLKEGVINIGLNDNVSFTRIRMASKKDGIQEEIVVVGTPTSVQTKMLKSNRMLLRG